MTSPTRPTPLLSPAFSGGTSPPHCDSAPGRTSPHRLPCALQVWVTGLHAPCQPSVSPSEHREPGPVCLARTPRGSGSCLPRVTTLAGHFANKHLLNTCNCSVWVLIIRKRPTCFRNRGSESPLGPTSHRPLPCVVCWQRQPPHPPCSCLGFPLAVP